MRVFVWGNAERDHPQSRSRVVTRQIASSPGEGLHSHQTTAAQPGVGLELLRRAVDNVDALQFT